MQHVAFKPTPSTGWWGEGYFRSSGAMGGVEEEASKTEEEQDGAEKKLGFDEDDQAALYMQVRTGHAHWCNMTVFWLPLSCT